MLFSAVPTGLCWGFLSHLNLPYQSFLLSVRWAPDEKKKRKHFLKFLAKWPVASGKTAIFYKKYICWCEHFHHRGKNGPHRTKGLQVFIPAKDCSRLFYRLAFHQPERKKMNHLLQSFSWIENLLALSSLCKIHVVQG